MNASFLLYTIHVTKIRTTLFRRSDIHIDAFRAGIDSVANDKFALRSVADIFSERRGKKKKQTRCV